MTTPILNFFVLVSKKNETLNLKRISLHQDVQKSLSEIIYTKGNHLKNLSPITDLQYKIDSNEIYQINNCNMPNEFKTAVREPQHVDPLTPQFFSSIRAIFSGACTDQKYIIYFQNFDKRRTLTKSKFAIFFSNETFTKLNKDILVMPEIISAVYIEGGLIFKSFKNANSIIDISQHYRMASNEEIKEGFLSSFKGDCNPEDFSDALRKKIATVIDNKILQSTKPSVIKRVCKKFGLELNIKSNKLTLPSSKKDIGKLVRILNDDYFESPLTNEKYETNSKRRIIT